MKMGGKVKKKRPGGAYILSFYMIKGGLEFFSLKQI
jgi:hypothetical protein